MAPTAGLIVAHDVREGSRLNRQRAPLQAPKLATHHALASPRDKSVVRDISLWATARYRGADPKTRANHCTDHELSTTWMLVLRVRCRLVSNTSFECPCS